MGASTQPQVSISRRALVNGPDTQKIPLKRRQAVDREPDWLSESRQWPKTCNKNFFWSVSARRSPSQYTKRRCLSQTKPRAPGIEPRLESIGGACLLASRTLASGLRRRSPSSTNKFRSLSVAQFVPREPAQLAAIDPDAVLATVFLFRPSRPRAPARKLRRPRDEAQARHHWISCEGFLRQETRRSGLPHLRGRMGGCLDNLCLSQRRKAAKP